MDTDLSRTSVKSTGRKPLVEINKMNGHQSETPKKKIVISNWILGAVVIAALGYGYHVEAEKEKMIPYQQALAASNKERADLEVARRQAGYVEVSSMTNAFGEVTASTYKVLSVQEGGTMYIERAGDDVRSICFNAVTKDDRKEMFAPIVSTEVDVKFDNGTTKNFRASRDVSSGMLCLDTVRRFLYNMEGTDNIKISIPFLEYSEKVRDIYEFNMKSYNGIIKNG